MELPERRLNVLLVQVESLDPWAIDAEVQGAPVMPFLRTLRERALVFASFFPQHRGGGSSDAELACLTSLLPLASHSGFMTFDASRVTTLANVLNEDGYTTVALHANVGSYFNRGPAYAGLGFDRFYDRAAFSGEAAGWSSKDSAFFRQSLELLEPLPQPWLAYLITMQSHGPFTNHDLEDTALPFTSEHSRLTRDYLLTMHEVDAALATLIEGIEGRRWLEHTIVLIFADHTSQVGPDDGPSRALGERIPMYVLAPDVPAGISHKVGSHLDLGPTILHLLGHPRPERWLGTSLLASGPGSTVVTVRGTPVVLVNGPDGRIDQVPPVRVRRHMEYSESILHP
jgi:phosphoglycerol transferase MdoB-like AlkP superfamily enzyme